MHCPPDGRAHHLTLGDRVGAIRRVPPAAGPAETSTPSHTSGRGPDKQTRPASLDCGRLRGQVRVPSASMASPLAAWCLRERTPVRGRCTPETMRGVRGGVTAASRAMVCATARRGSAAMCPTIGPERRARDQIARAAAPKVAAHRPSRPDVHGSDGDAGADGRYRARHARGAELAMLHAPSMMRRLLERTGVDATLNVIDDPAAAPRIAS